MRYVWINKIPLSGLWLVCDIFFGFAIANPKSKFLVLIPQARISCEDSLVMYNVHSPGIGSLKIQNVH